MGIQWDWKGGFEITRFLSRSLCSLMGTQGVAPGVVHCLKGIERECRDRSPCCSRVSLTLFPLKGSTKGGRTITGSKGSSSDAPWKNLQVKWSKKIRWQWKRDIVDTSTHAFCWNGHIWTNRTRFSTVRERIDPGNHRVTLLWPCKVYRCRSSLLWMGLKWSMVML